MPSSLGCHRACLHQCHVEAAATILILPSPSWLPWGLSYCFLNATLRKQSAGQMCMFSPFSVFKAVSSWEVGPLCCWDFSCLWQRERGLERGDTKGGRWLQAEDTLQPGTLH